jgi:WD40 repeat protein
MAAAAELRVRSARLPGFPPFPTWNGTIAAPSIGDKRGLCSVLGSDGELVVLEQQQLDSRTDATSDICLRVRKVVPPPAEENFSSFCQCWSPNGSVVVTAHDRSVVFYSSEDFHVLARLQLRYCVTSVGIASKQCDDEDSSQEYLLIVGTAFGSFLYQVSLRSDQLAENGNGGEGQDAAHEVPTLVAGLLDGVAVCMVKFSDDGHTAAIGTMDGRLFLRRFDSHDADSLTSFGTTGLSRVLLSPRVTSMSFSSCGRKLVVATRKGNVYVFASTSASGEWHALPSCQGLSANPKVGGPTGTSKAVTAAQTLVACWGPVFVVCSRAVTSRLEVYDFASGRLLHVLQLAPAAHQPSGWTSSWSRASAAGTGRAAPRLSARAGCCAMTPAPTSSWSSGPSWTWSAAASHGRGL